MTDVGTTVTRLLETRDLSCIEELDDYLLDRRDDPLALERLFGLRVALRAWHARVLGSPYHTDRYGDFTAGVAWREFASDIRRVFHFDLVDVAATVAALRPHVPDDAQAAAAAAAYTDTLAAAAADAAVGDLHRRLATGRLTVAQVRAAADRHARPPEAP